MKKRISFDESNPGYQKLINGLKQADDDYINGLNLSSMSAVKFSEKYDKNMKRLIKRQKRSYWKFINSAGKKAAIVVLALILSFIMSLNIQAIRTPVFGFFDVIFDKFSEIFADKSEISEYPTTIEEVYTLTGLPEGFVETSCEVSEIKVDTYWKSNGVIIRLYQHILSGKSTLDTEYSEYQKVEYNGYEIFYINEGGLTSIIWHNGQYRFSIDWYDTIPIEKMLELTDTLKIKT